MKVSLLGRFHVGHSLVVRESLRIIPASHGWNRTIMHMDGARSTSPYSYSRTPSKTRGTILILYPHPRFYALLGSQGNTITYLYHTTRRKSVFGRGLDLFKSRTLQEKKKSCIFTVLLVLFCEKPYLQDGPATNSCRTCL